MISISIEISVGLVYKKNIELHGKTGIVQYAVAYCKLTWSGKLWMSQP